MVRALGVTFPEADFVIVAQNYGLEELSIFDSEKTKLYVFDEALTIGVARKVLEEKILELNYDYAILCDDDIICVADERRGKAYLDIMQQYDVFFTQPNLLHLAGISRKVMLETPIPILNASENEGYEDCIYYNILKVKYKDTFNEMDVGVLLKNGVGYMSTWYDSERNSHGANMKGVAVYLYKQGIIIDDPCLNIYNYPDTFEELGINVETANTEDVEAASL